jgi:hypothetical protein
MVDKTPRSVDSRAASPRPKPWKPPSSLDAPPPPEGYAHRWIRAESAGLDDRKNLFSRLREGFELVRAEEYPNFEVPTVQDGAHAGVIGVGGLLLARVPLETVQQRNAYYRGQANDQINAVDNDLLREQHPSMPIIKPERQSRVTFGGNRATE